MKQILDEIIEKLPEEFNMVEIMNKVEERTPYGPQAFVDISAACHRWPDLIEFVRSFPCFRDGRYIIVAFQECERMNYLTGEMKRSLKELDLGLKGELTITYEMEVLENALFLDQVPQIWSSRAYPSLLGLTSWFVDLLMRLRELETWSTDFVVTN